MIVAAHLTAVLVASPLVARVLTRATWTWRATRTGIVTWQAIGLAWVLSVVGLPLAIGLEPYRTGPLRALTQFVVDVTTRDLPSSMTPVRVAAVIGGLALGTLFAVTQLGCLVQAVRTRARHRQLLGFVAREDAAVPGALVLDHPAAAVYCLPGIRSTVVVSAGTLDLLDRAELAAVLSHERAHAQERHDLVLLPFTALRRALPRTPWPVRAYDAVALLIEMRADDSAVRRGAARGPLTAALLRFATKPTPGGTPRGAIAMADRDLEPRIRRLLAEGPAPRAVPALSLALGFFLLATPVSVLLQ